MSPAQQLIIDGFAATTQLDDRMVDLLLFLQEVVRKTDMRHELYNAVDTRVLNEVHTKTNMPVGDQTSGATWVPTQAALNLASGGRR